MRDFDVFFGLPRLLIARSSESRTPIETKFSAEIVPIIGEHASKFSWINQGRSEDVKDGENHGNQKNDDNRKTRTHGNIWLPDSESATSVYPETAISDRVPKIRSLLRFRWAVLSDSEAALFLVSHFLAIF